jgi:hypothetical protein
MVDRTSMVVIVQSALHINPLPVQFISLLHGQEGSVFFFQWAFKYMYVPVRLSTFSPAGDIYIQYVLVR